MQRHTAVFLGGLGLVAVALAALVLSLRALSSPSPSVDPAPSGREVTEKQRPGGPTLHLGLRETVRPGGMDGSRSPGGGFLVEEHYLGNEQLFRTGPLEVSFFAAADGLQDVRLTDGEQVLFTQAEAGLYLSGKIRLPDARRAHRLVLSARDGAGRVNSRAVTVQDYRIAGPEPLPESPPAVQAANGLTTERQPVSGPGFSGTLYLHNWKAQRGTLDAGELALLVSGPWQSMRLYRDDLVVYATEPPSGRSPSHALVAFPNAEPGQLRVEAVGTEGAPVVRVLEVARPSQAAVAALAPRERG